MSLLWPTYTGHFIDYYVNHLTHAVIRIYLSVYGKNNKYCRYQDSSHQCCAWSEVNVVNVAKCASFGHTHTLTLSPNVFLCEWVCVLAWLWVCASLSVCVLVCMCVCVCERGRVNHSTTCIDKEMQTLLLYFVNPLTRALDIKWFWYQKNNTKISKGFPLSFDGVSWCG